MKLPLKKIILFTTMLIAVTAWSPHPYAAQEDEFVIGLIPEENIFRMIKRHRPLAAYLSRELGIKVRFTILSRYGDIVDRFVSRDMDGAFFGIFTSLLAMEKLGVEPIARPVNLDGGTTAQGYLFTRKDSGIKTLEDMRGKRAVFVDRATATGYVFAIAYLRKKGITDIDEFFSEYYFTGSHDSAIYAVLDGKADIGAVKGRILDALSAKDPIIKEEVHVIARSRNLPDTTLCVKKGMNPELKEKLKKALLSLGNQSEGAEVLKQMGILKFVDASKDDFREVADLAISAGIELKEYR